MSNKDISNNPFAELFKDKNKQTSAAALEKQMLNNDSEDILSMSQTLIGQQGSSEDKQLKHVAQTKLRENELVERIFMITLNPNLTEINGKIKPYIFLQNLHTNLNNQTWIDSECLNQAVFERLLMPKEEINAILSSFCFHKTPTSMARESKQGEILQYLFDCYIKLYEEIPDLSISKMQHTDQIDISKDFKDQKIQFGVLVKEIIITNAATALQSSDLYSQDIIQQFIDIFLENISSTRRNHILDYLLAILSHINTNDGYNTLYETLKPIFEKTYKTFSETLTIVNSTLFDYMELLLFFTQTSFIAKAFLEYSTPAYLKSRTKYGVEAPNKANANDGPNPHAPILPSPSTSSLSSESSTANAFRRALNLGLATSSSSSGAPSNNLTTTNNSSNNNNPSQQSSQRGKAFEKTLLGAAISISCIPRNFGHPMLFFNNVSNLSRQEHKIMEQNLWKPLSALVEKMYNVFYSLLKISPDVKHLTLTWLGHCLHANTGRAKIWSTQVPEIYAATYASDPFMLNLGSILLRLCKPFSYPNSQRILKVDMTYLRSQALSDEMAKEFGLHAIGLKDETCLVPHDNEGDGTSEADQAPTKPYNFVTECLFLTEQCLNLGFRVVVSKFLKLNQELGRLQVYYESLLSANNGNEDSSPAIRNIKDAMEKGLSHFLCMKAALLEPHFLEGAFNLSVAVCQLICHEINHRPANNSNEVQQKSASTTAIQTCFVAPEDLLTFVKIVQPTVDPDQGGTEGGTEKILSFVPEFFVENMLDLMSLLSHFSDESLDYYGPSALEHILVFVLTMMGSPERTKNPHLRAKMAETLEALIPNDARRASDTDEDEINNPQSSPYGSSNRNWSLGIGGGSSSSCRSQLFVGQELIGLSPYAQTSMALSDPNTTSYRQYMIPVLIHVFVSIEETGHNVAFEQKFSYRRPMYVVLRYLWKHPFHRAVVQRMAADAERNIEAINPPLFLRFINLLINDAIFLLDEGLSFMSQLREIQIKKDAGEWDKISPQQRNENEGNLQHLGLMARYHNVLGLETIRALDYITRHTHTIFTHSSMVNRITSMLNYFLLHLVGPKKKNLKVKDLSAFEFRPQEIVTTICQIYVNLGNSLTFFDSSNFVPEDCSNVKDSEIEGSERKKKSLKTSPSGEQSQSSVSYRKVLKDSEESFCRGVSQDGRSYSPGLFIQAIDVLNKIGNKAVTSSFSSSSTFKKTTSLITQLQIVSQKVNKFAIQQEQEDEMMGDIPDEFLDPIMSTLMTNPVILPTSGIVLDRATIARHLLSDQTDPFNRHALTLEEVKPDDVLRKKIEEWVLSKRTNG